MRKVPGLTAYLIILLLSFVCYSSYSQNISGRWQGKSYWVESEGDSSDVFLDIQYDSVSNRFAGTCITISNDFYGKANIRGRYNKRKNKFYIMETLGMETNYPVPVDEIILEKYILTFKSDAGPALYGPVEASPYNHNLTIFDEKGIILFRTEANPPIIPTYIGTKDSIWIDRLRRKENFSLKDF